MNKVITINLGGTAYQLEETGYDALRAYLEAAGARLQNNPDRGEILSDIEASIGEKFRGRLNAHKNVVTAQEVAAVLAEMGPIEDDSSAHAPGGAARNEPKSECDEPRAAGAAGAGPVKRLYRIYDGAMVSGVCNGLGAYFGVDPTIVRVAFVLLTLAWGAGALVYLLLVIVVPVAKSPEEKAASAGEPFTAQEFIKRARAGYYGAMRDFHDHHARREWKRRFREEMRGWRRSFRREMRAGAWGRSACFSEGGAVPPTPTFALPFISVMHGMLAVLMVCAVITLLATGTLLGAALPANLPVWVALLLMLFAYGMVSWPLKAARRAFYHGAFSGPPWAWSAAMAVDWVVWLAVVAVMLWLAVKHLPMAQDAVHNLPGVARDAAHSIREWWSSW
ncbi:MAG: PspC domain-containing protein [Opitutae bacterium]|nr:PspC domain-containing protein [Opitutae bacterium]